MGELTAARKWLLKQQRRRRPGKAFCVSCKGWLPLSDFNRVLRDRRRRRKKCAHCCTKEAAYVASHKAKKLEYDQARMRNETKERRDARNVRRRELYATDGGRRRRYENERKRGTDRQLEKQERRARLMAAGGQFTQVEWEVLKRHYGFRCAYCGKRKKLTMDHVVPLIRGGRHDESNIVPACVNCNAQKHTADWSHKLRKIS